MAALYRNKLLTVHSEILAGMRIVVWGWSVALTAMKKIFYTPCNKFCFVLWPHTSNFSLPLKYSTKEKTSTSLHLIQGQATWIDWLTYRCVCWGGGDRMKAWPFIPMWETLKGPLILWTSHRIGGSLHWDSITTQRLLIPNPAPFPFFLQEVITKAV